MRSSPYTSSEQRVLSANWVVIFGVLLAGCHRGSVPLRPTVEIRQVPSANPGGPVQMGFMEGRVSGAAPDQQIVLYAHSGIWWVQPFANQAFTKIQPDATWKNSTHLGTEYAALLVDAGYRPVSKLSALPAEGNGVIAVATAKGKASSSVVPKVIHFSGYNWTVRAASSDRGGEPNSYDPANVWTDEKGFLHLDRKSVV